MSEKETARVPAISVILPVLGEGGGIVRSLSALRLTARGAAFETIVVDGDPAGSTLRCLEDQDACLLTAPGDRAGRMNAGARAATGEVLLFLHAGTFLPDGWPDMVRRALANGLADAGAFDRDFTQAGCALRLIARAGSLRSRLERVPCGDQALFVRAGYFQALGGFADIPVLEDVEFLRRIRRGGGQVLILPARVRVSPRRYLEEGVLRRVLRDWSLRLGYTLGRDPHELARWYRPRLPRKFSSKTVDDL